jgi:hypothetical protein
MTAASDDKCNETYLNQTNIYLAIYFTFKVSKPSCVSSFVEEYNINSLVEETNKKKQPEKKCLTKHDET